MGTLTGMIRFATYREMDIYGLPGDVRTYAGDEYKDMIAYLKRKPDFYQVVRKTINDRASKDRDLLKLL